MDTSSYTLEDLTEEVRNRYTSKRDSTVFILFIDKYAVDQSFIMLDSNENFKGMLSMGEDEVTGEPYEDDDSDQCPSEESYHSRLSSDIEDDRLNYEGETYSNVKRNSTMKVYSRFSNVIDFRRALNHHAITNEFDYFIEKSEPTRFTARCINMECGWKIHASLMEDGITFQVQEHSCIRSNKAGNRRATQGWIANIVTDKLKSDGDVGVPDLMKWISKTYNVELPCHKVFRGKEQAYTDVYGKWEDSFVMIDDFKEELHARDPRSVVDIEFEKDGDKKRFLRFFISFAACSTGFLVGCRPNISLDACHLKGNFNGVLAAATAIDGNNSIFPVAYGVLESENTKSWTWFLELLERAIGTPNGLVISSDMQKGLEVAITQVYPNIEHRECIRHLYSNLKRHFHDDFFYFKLWGAAIAYCVNDHDRLLDEIDVVRKEAITYLNDNHNKIWSRCKFGTTSKCDYITNNISESFNSWVGDLRYRPVLDLLDAIREKLMKRFDKKRRNVKKWKGSLVPMAKNYVRTITKNLGEYAVSRSSDNRAEVTYKGKRWDVTLDEKKCSC
uniref:uncharacterized protein LOC122595313 n=1 Tax=Erigeron canadensis TaxID=72917 RepID=UPI001CB8A85C|nr:uncharacterized protein LOC122595313 [Erigeron canadensis]